MKQKIKELVEKLASELNWSVSFKDLSDTLTHITFTGKVIGGKEFEFDVECDDNDTEEMIYNVRDYFESFDPEEKATSWIESTHIAFNFEDVVREMSSCRNHLGNLLSNLEDNSSSLYEASLSKYKVQITETFQRVVEVDGYNIAHACGIANDMWYRDEIDLDLNDFKNADFEPYEE